MRSAFVGHGYHKITSSSAWFIDIISSMSGVDVFWDEKWNHLISSPDLDIERLLSYDRIYVWQVDQVAQKIAEVAPQKLLFIPMWDGVYTREDAAWRCFQNTRILSFAWVLHERLRRLGINSFHCQYFPDPNKFQQVSDFSSMRGYLWQRRQEIGWAQVEALSQGVAWDRFQLHVGMDPTYGEVDAPTVAQMRRNNIQISRFAKDGAEVKSAVDDANIYFAPRLVEGIGMSFLEAMARGQCVVAPNSATMSEYITHGITGLLYDPMEIEPLDFNAAEKIGAAARRHVEYGFEDWTFDLKHRLPEILFPDGSGLAPPRTRIGAEWHRAPAATSPRQRKGKPKVTVAVVTFNAAATFESTLDSITEQTFADIEVVVVDGGSTDGTMALIEKYRHRIDVTVSEPDNGPYDAMNKAARLGSGEFIIYMNSGDSFATRDSVMRAIQDAPEDVDFIIGHHIYLTVDRREQFHRATCFDDTWNNLISGKLSHQWLSGVPCHQATYTRRELLIEEGGYLGEFEIAADHEFMYRMRQKGKQFFHCGETLAVYVGGGHSALAGMKCIEEWWQLARMYGEPNSADKFFRTMAEEQNSKKRSPNTKNNRRSLLRRIIHSLPAYNSYRERRKIRRRRHRQISDIGGRSVV